MSKALVIKSADFSANSIEQIVVEEPVPCTGISLNKNTITADEISGTETLIATVTPADCTQPVAWTTSNADVATVSNGVVTFVGLGTATITATCGDYSATCDVTVDNVVVDSGFKFVYLSNTDGRDYVSENHPHYSFMTLCDVVPLDTSRLRFSASASTPQDYIAPYGMPKGTKRVKVHADTNLYCEYTCYVFFLNSKENASGFPLLAKMLKKTRYDRVNQSIDVTDNVPEDADSVALFVRAATAYAEGYDVDVAAQEHNFTVTFMTEEA